MFVLASKDGWVSIMYTGLDAVGVDQQVGVLSIKMHHSVKLFKGKSISVFKMDVTLISAKVKPGKT